MSEQHPVWPDAFHGAVSLTFDDGMRSQLERAIPTLNEYGLKGTFYVNPRGEDWKADLLPWRDVAATGHEVGNHTISHPCSWAFKTIRDTGLERMSLKDMEEEITTGKRRIHEAIPDQGEHTFCYPCYHTHIGEGKTRQSYVPIVAKHHVAGRAKGDYANHPVTADLHHLMSFPVERRSAAEMIGLIEEAMSQDRWAILTFHGIHEGHLAVADGDFRTLCAHLHRNHSRIWTAPVVAVAEYVLRFRTVSQG